MNKNTALFIASLCFASILSENVSAVPLEKPLIVAYERLESVPHLMTTLTEDQEALIKRARDTLSRIKPETEAQEDPSTNLEVTTAQKALYDHIIGDFYDKIGNFTHTYGPADIEASFDRLENLVNAAEQEAATL